MILKPAVTDLEGAIGIIINSKLKVHSIVLLQEPDLTNGMRAPTRPG
jgi:hypothetical protein